MILRSWALSRFDNFGFVRSFFGFFAMSLTHLLSDVVGQDISTYLSCAKFQP